MYSKWVIFGCCLFHVTDYRHHIQVWRLSALYYLFRGKLSLQLLSLLITITSPVKNIPFYESRHHPKVPDFCLCSYERLIKYMYSENYYWCSLFGLSMNKKNLSTGTSWTNARQSRKTYLRKIWPVRPPYRTVHLCRDVLDGNHSLKIKRTRHNFYACTSWL
jgi:hypothetical protein